MTEIVEVQSSDRTGASGTAAQSRTAEDFEASRPATQTPKSERLLGIQFARGLAALIVVVYHGSRMVAQPQYAGHKAFGGFFEFGYAGVDFFFVLSGFIIYFVHHRDLDNPNTLSRYIWRRLTRIYPNYWLILAIAIAAMSVNHASLLTPAHFLKSLLLLPDTQEPLLGVAWTLVYEMLFYTVFAVGIFNLRLGILAALVWLGLIVGGAGHLRAPLFAVVGSSLNFEFLMGIVAAMIVLKVKVPLPRGLALVGVLALFGAGLAENASLLVWASTESHLIFGFCAMAITVGIASAERQGALRVGSVGEFFGGASYLLYLVHTLIIGFTLQILRVTGVVQRIPGWTSVLLAVIASVIAAGILYQFYDLRIQAVLNRIGRERFFSKAPTGK